jgi:hypothetical protein
MSSLCAAAEADRALHRAREQANVVFAVSGRAVYKLNSSTFEVLDSYSGEEFYIDGKLRSELYLSKGWLIVWGEEFITKLNASDLSAPIATLDLQYHPYREIQNVVIDEERAGLRRVRIHERVDHHRRGHHELDGELHIYLRDDRQRPNGSRLHGVRCPPQGALVCQQAPLHLLDVCASSLSIGSHPPSSSTRLS